MRACRATSQQSIQMMAKECLWMVQLIDLRCCTNSTYISEPVSGGSEAALTELQQPVKTFPCACFAISVFLFFLDHVSEICGAAEKLHLSQNKQNHLIKAFYIEKKIKCKL